MIHFYNWLKTMYDQVKLTEQHDFSIIKNWLSAICNFCHVLR